MRTKVRRMKSIASNNQRISNVELQLVSRFYAQDPEGDKLIILRLYSKALHRKRISQTWNLTNWFLCTFHSGRRTPLKMLDTSYAKIMDSLKSLTTPKGIYLWFMAICDPHRDCCAVWQHVQQHVRYQINLMISIHRIACQHIITASLSTSHCIITIETAVQSISFDLCAIISRLSSHLIFHHRLYPLTSESNFVRSNSGWV